MDKSIALLLAILFLVSSLAGTHVQALSENTSQTGFISRPSGFGFYFTVGDGYAGPLKVLYLSGNDYDRGYEYGYLAAKEIDQILNWAYNVLASAQGIPADQWRQGLLYMASQYEPYIPDEYITMMQGMADGYNEYYAEHDGSLLGYNLTYLDFVMVNSFVDFSCTGAVISGNLTVSGNPILGTTIDAEPLGSHFIFVVEKPETGYGIAYFTVAGSIFQNGMNSEGLGMIEHHIEGWENVVGMPEMIRDRYVLQYASDVNEAISLFQQLNSTYGFSGYGDDVSLSDKYNNIAKLEVTPFVIGVIINPTGEPTWPKEDPFIKHLHSPPISNYVILYREGYDNILRGDGWIVNGLYTLNETVVGLPGFPSSWEEAITSENYTWLWKATERYMIGHYIYAKILRGEKFSLADGVIMSQLPLVGEQPADDGAIWMEPNTGIAVIMKGQASFAKPIVLKVFNPTVSEENSLQGLSIATQTPSIETLASLLEVAFSNNMSLDEIQTILQQESTNLAQTLEDLNSTLQNTNNNIVDLQQEINKQNTTLNNLKNSINNLNNIASQIQTVQTTIQQEINGVNQNLQQISQQSETQQNLLKDNLNKLKTLNIATLIIILIAVAGAAYWSSRTGI